MNLAKSLPGNGALWGKREGGHNKRKCIKWPKSTWTNQGNPIYEGQCSLGLCAGHLQGLQGNRLLHIWRLNFSISKKFMWILFKIDSCKFMHDRTDYKHGWEIERDWQEGKMKEAKDDEYLINSEEGEGDSDEDGGGGGKLPHSCHICREHFKQPVVTK